jgi:PAS domain S-box-containing protein
MRRSFFRQRSSASTHPASGETASRETLTRAVSSTSSPASESLSEALGDEALGDEDEILMSPSRMRLTRMRAVGVARRTVLASCMVALVLAALSLASWSLHWAQIEPWWPGGMEVTRQTSLAILLGVGALALLGAPGVSTQVRGRFWWFLVAIGVLCLLSLLGVGSERMMPLTSFCLQLFAIGLWLLEHQAAHRLPSSSLELKKVTPPYVWFAQIVLCAALLLCLMSLYGSMLGVTYVRNAPPLMAMPLPVTVALLALCTGALCLRPHLGVMRLLTDGGVAGITMRRLLPAATVIPLVLGWLRLLGERQGHYDTPSGVVLVTVGCVAVFNLAILHNARLLRRLDERRRAAERALQRARDHLEDEVRARTFELTQTNENLSRAIEERRAAQALSTQFSAILDTLVRSAAIGFTFIDRDLRYVAINDALARMNGLPVEAHIGRQLRDVLPELAPHIEPVLRGVMESGEAIIDMEVEGKTPGGSGEKQFWLASYYPVRRMDGEVLGVGIFAQDVTARKRAEVERNELLQREREARQLAEVAREQAESARLQAEVARLQAETARHQAETAREEAEIANRTKDEFLATLSHELRTPLNAILGWANLLRAGGVDEASTQKALETIERNARAQTLIIEDILDVSRIVTGKLRLELSPLDLWPIVQSACEAVRPTAGAKNLTLNLRPEDETLRVPGDATRLHQVMWNLLSNAVKFTPSGGRIDVALRRVWGEAEIEVRDSGQGIAPEFLPFVFERFRQADASSTRRHGGLGLGLALVRHIVELHGGTIVVESAGAGQGSVFRIRLPLAAHETPDADAPQIADALDTTDAPLAADAPQVADAPAENHVSGEEDFTDVSAYEYSTEPKAPNINGRAPQSAPPEISATETARPLQGLRILLVEDQTDTREMLFHALTSYGAQVEATSNAHDAREAWRTQPLDVIVSDVEMPDENGYELIRSLRAQNGGVNSPRIAAIALTAHARAEDQVRARDAGFDLHVAKPFHMTHLVQSILRAMAQAAATNDA